MKRIAMFLLMACTAIPATADIRSLLQMVDYMGVDYPEAVENGKIINEGEYTEMVEFANRIDREIADLGPSPAKEKITALADRLGEAVDRRAPPVDIANMTRKLRELLMANYDVVLTPRHQPDLNAAANLYAQSCASCHGAEGFGNGPAAAGMEPPPTDFNNTERAHQRTLYGLYNTITLGVDGTAMIGRPDLTDSQRWALAFYVGAMHVDDATASRGEQFWAKQPLDLESVVTQTPAEIANVNSDGEALSAWARKNPGTLFKGKPEPLDVAERNLEQSLSLYKDRQIRAAQQHAIDAYLEGFELIEAPLSNVDSQLMRRAEQGLMAYRRALDKEQAVAQVEARYDEAMALLEESRALLSGDALSPGVAFTGSLVILLREGLEAILVLAAIIAFLSRSGNRDALKYVHTGWVLALVAGAATWVLATYIVNISGATREITEGIAALAAAVILLYVGFWMHRNADAQRWSRYLEDKMQTALTSRTLWTLCIVAFLAVYREIFETILFYQALWTQVDETSQPAVFYGGGLALVLLLVIAWGIARYSVRLPLRQFFLGSAILMVVLAFIFTGKGVAALQEAGRLPSDPVAFPTIDVLGIYPNIQALVLQALVVTLAVAAIVYEKFSRRAPVDQ